MLVYSWLTPVADNSASLTAFLTKSLQFLQESHRGIESGL